MSGFLILFPYFVLFYFPMNECINKIKQNIGLWATNKIKKDKR